MIAGQRVENGRNGPGRRNARADDSRGLVGWNALGEPGDRFGRSAEARRLQHAKPRGRVVDGPHGASPDVRFLARGDLSNSAVRRALRSRAGLLAHRVGQEEQQEGVVAEGQLLAGAPLCPLVVL